MGTNSPGLWLAIQWLLAGVTCAAALIAAEGVAQFILGTLQDFLS
jgi:hypothetical protein